MGSLYARSRERGGRADPFVDLLFNTLMGFVFLFMVSLIFINPEARKANVEKQAEYVISATWPDHLKDDVDLWVRSPSNHTVSYLQEQAGWLHLDRDDRGIVNDIIIVDGEEKVYPVNQEIVTIRKRAAGEYIVNLYYYDAASPPPVPVEIRVDRVNPRFKTVYHRTLNLTRVDEEVTAVRFSITDSGDITGISTLPAVLTPYSLDFMPSWAN